MRKLIAIAALSLFLGGCHQTVGSAFNVGSFLTTGITLPLGQRSIDTMNASWGIVLGAYDAYHDSCSQRLQPVYPSCRTAIPKIRLVLSNVNGKVRQARTFARNPTANAFDAINAASDAINDAKVLMMELGVKI